jgi:DNA-binding transcriptional MerR regulator
MWIGQAARAAGVNQQTFRYYERRGLLPRPPRRGAFRTYEDETVRIVQFVKRAQELGFSLDEVEQLLSLRGVPSDERHRVRAIAERKLTDIDAKIDQLRAMRRALAKVVASCHRGGTPSCPIIESLSAPLHPWRRSKAMIRG